MSAATTAHVDNQPMWNGAILFSLGKFSNANWTLTGWDRGTFSEFEGGRQLLTAAQVLLWMKFLHTLCAK
jgi:hypothetical protein